MSIVLIGVNHKSAPVEVRELLAFSDEACTQGLRTLIDGEVLREGLIVSTCNRVEVVTAMAEGQSTEGMARVTSFLSDSRKLPLKLLDRHLYNHTDADAVTHLFRVASSLDSMVVGEPQVLGQVRRAYSLAIEAGTAGRVLNRLIHHTFRVAKRVRSETGIAANAVSLSYMAVELGKKIFDSLAGRTVMLVGAGEMAELSARHLVNGGASRLLIANRNEDAARRLVQEFGGEVVDFNHMAPHLAQADFVICSTSADEYIVTEALVRESLAQRRNRPACFIDMSVPRNVDPAIGKMPNMFLFDVDDLEAVVASNIREREREAERAELIVQSEVMQFQQSLRAMDIGPAMGALRHKLQDIARTELDRQRGRLGKLTPEQEAAIEALLISTVNKISHPVLTQMRRSFEASDAETLQSLRDVFGIDE
ncbi:MAG: glutamyl-tRNA reductase [Acidobacteria bacterium]|nr:MAG: glutamyl-tRNA reductase [Acidobacteriota bacterium]